MVHDEAEQLRETKEEEKEIKLIRVRDTSSGKCGRYHPHLSIHVSGDFNVIFPAIEKERRE
ncbi:uncharacterized protein G2W53_043825 [Senna tora]|uniref:Uncharacterized protein n=1 Tax=Senna tora TaxID=362788 RepID=A0A834SJB2_9FABA|nr:uncharacterized protein G2W53_043825 [Senna tora]